MRQSRLLPSTALIMFTLALTACGGAQRADDADRPAANPCAAMANPCAVNPCAPRAAIDPTKIRQEGRALYAGLSREQLVARGETLWNDPSLSGSGAVACATCHVDNYAQMQASFAEPYPHRVAMANERANLDRVTAAEMVQLCRVIPMAAEPLAWNSPELAALTAYVEDIQKGFTASMVGNPCAANPCAANPCKASNPCKGMNPCKSN